MEREKITNKNKEEEIFSTEELKLSDQKYLLLFK